MNCIRSRISISNQRLENQLGNEKSLLLEKEVVKTVTTTQRAKCPSTSFDILVTRNTHSKNKLEFKTSPFMPFIY